MKKILLSGSLAILLTPAFALAAYNDVSLTTSANISAGGVTLNVSGTTAVVQSITVNASTFSFTLLSGSSIQVTSATGQFMNHNADSSVVATDSCSGGTSILKFTSSGPTATVTVTPSSTTACSGHATVAASSNTTTTTTSGGNNGGPVASGGGGGGGSTPAATTAVTQPAATTVSPATSGASNVTALQTQLNMLLAQIAALKGGTAQSASAYASTNASFKRNLQVGSTGSDVKALQVWLNARGYTIAKSGPGSSGHETTKFGGSTRAALKAFQKSVGIKPANGSFGSKTRVYIASHQ